MKPAKISPYGQHTTRKTACQLLLLLCVISPATLLAEEADVEPVNWAYSSVFGTGWYTVENNQSLFALSLPVRQTLRHSSISESGNRGIGFEIDYALSVGFYNIDDLPGLIDPDNFGSVVFTPGLIMEIPITQRWHLRPYANFGWGSKLGSSDSAWIYYTGIKSRYTLPTASSNWALINSIYYAGYTPSVGPSNDLAVIQAGIEYRQQLNKTSKKGDPIDLHWTLAYSYLGDELTFGLPDGDIDAVDDQFEAAVAYGYRNRPIKLWFMEFDNIGIGYRFSSNGTFKGISLNLGSWFVR
jgi:hypothetical protein